MTWAEKQARALARPRPAGASPRGLRAARRCFQGAVERSRAQAAPGTPGCRREGEREKHRQLLLRQRFKRRFWLPLHFVRNPILSVCAVCSQHAYRVEARGAGAEEHLLSGAQSAGCEPEPRQRTGGPAPAWPAPVGSGSGTRGGSPSPRTRTPPSTLPPEPPYAFGVAWRRVGPKPPPPPEARLRPGSPLPPAADRLTATSLVAPTSPPPPE